MLSVFVVSFVYAADKNFVSVLNGSSFTRNDTASLKSFSFIGQPVVFNTNDTVDLVSVSGFAASISNVKSSSITFVNQTSEEIFKDVNVPVKVKIDTVFGNITKVRYRIRQGTDSVFEDEIDYTGALGSSSVIFSTNVVFNRGEAENYIQVYAQATSGSEYTGGWSPEYTIRIDQSINSPIEITSPDSMTKMSSLDPIIKTTEFSLNHSTVTVSLYKGNSVITGEKLYEINLDTTTNLTYRMYDENLGAISYLNSDIITIYNEEKSLNIPTKLQEGKEYTLSISANDETRTLTFKALSGGVANVLTYPSPFNPKKENIKIRYLLAKDSRVTIKLYDKAGKIVCKLIQSESRNAGTNEEQWNGKNYAAETLATGAYIVEIIAKSSTGEDRKYTALAIVGK